MEEQETCPEIVYFWDGEYEGNCLRTKGHDMPHCDGDYHWTDDDAEGAFPAHEGHSHQQEKP